MIDGYSGPVRQTESGEMCQNWNSRYPHDPHFSAGNHNKCANPDNDQKGPWCYTMNPDKRFEYCDIPKCKEVSRQNCWGKIQPYRGNMSTTKNGYTCQKWRKNHPHRPNFKPKDPNHNYCRNPDDDDEGPWCYTTSRRKRFDYCDIPKCSEILGPSQESLTTTATTSETDPLYTTDPYTDPYTTDPLYTTIGEESLFILSTKTSTTSPSTSTVTVTESIEDIINKDCWSESKGYEGTVSETFSGKTCQRWDKNYPQNNLKFRPPDSSHNFCRMPDKDAKGPWCYTTDRNTRYEFCDVPKCGAAPPKSQCGVPDQFNGLRKGTALLSNGRISDEGEGRILYGKSTLEKMIPWQVKLHGPAGCGGTLVSMQTVISAAHCTIGSSAEEWRVSVGHIASSSKRASREDGYQERKIKFLQTHQYESP